jgi:hypothetical protein
MRIVRDVILSFFAGGALFLIVGALADILPTLMRRAHSLPLVGIWVIYLIIGGCIVSAYNRFSPKKEE